MSWLDFTATYYNGGANYYIVIPTTLSLNRSVKATVSYIRGRLGDAVAVVRTHMHPKTMHLSLYVVLITIVTGGYRK